MRLKVASVLLLILSISLVSSFTATDQWSKVSDLATSSGYSLDQNNNGIIDSGNSLSAPGTFRNINTANAWHSISEIGDSSGNPIDANGNGWPDVCESLTPPSLTVHAGSSFELISQISLSNSDSRAIDSNNDGWPDKCDCILSLLNTDSNNCGSCGHACTAGQTCNSGTCCVSNVGQACGGSSCMNPGTIDCSGNCIGATSAGGNFYSWAGTCTSFCTAKGCAASVYGQQFHNSGLCPTGTGGSGNYGPYSGNYAYCSVISAPTYATECVCS